MRNLRKIAGLLCMAMSMLALPAPAQTCYNTALLDTLEQIAAQETPAKYFAQAYHRVIELTNDYAAKQPGNVRDFVFGFESLFAPLFFQSYDRYIRHQPQDSPWIRYYAGAPKNPLQYIFMGMNAHINGDMCLALVNKYQYDTLKKYRVPLLRFQYALKEYFYSVCNTAGNYRKVRTMHWLSLGTDRWWGACTILRWRIRQERLALMYYRHPKRYRQKNKRLLKKMERYDAFALRWIR